MLFTYVNVPEGLNVELNVVTRNQILKFLTPIFRTLLAVLVKSTIVKTRMNS